MIFNSVRDARFVPFEKQARSRMSLLLKKTAKNKTIFLEKRELAGLKSGASCIGFCLDGETGFQVKGVSVLLEFGLLELFTYKN